MRSENISTPMMSPIYVECYKMYQSMVCVQEFQYFVSGLDIQIEKSEYDSPVCQKSNRYKPMAQLLRLQGCRKSGNMDLIPDE